MDSDLPVVAMDVVEVLFEYKGSRRELLHPVSTLCDRIEQELEGLGVAGATVTLCAGSSQTDDDDSPRFFLQRWSSKWQTFVNVESICDIHGDDRLTVVRKPISSPVKVW